jgi:arylsulfatase A-like enzyme
VRRALLLLALALAPGCGGSPRPNVLLITVDTLRADRLGCYGYERPTTPELDAFAAEGILFERAYSQAPFTAPSHASLFTSLHSNEHGVLSWGMKIPPDAQTLAERFAAQGWRTGAFYNHPSLEFADVERGFHHVEKRFFQPAADTLEGFLAWLDADKQPEGEEGEPFCAWVHLWDVHRPYGYRDWSFVAKEVPRRPLAFEETRFGSYADVTVGRGEGDYNADPLRRQDRTRPPEAWGFVEDRYDGGVWYADQALGALFRALRERGLLEDTVIVVTSDHGESLRERDPVWFTHDPFLYEETLRVPLIVRLPGGERGGERVSALARGIDVLPTLLEAADLPAAGTHGRSLLDLPEDEGRPVYLFAQTQTRRAKERGGPTQASDGWFERRETVSDGRLKLLVDRNTGRQALFDLERDPLERRDVSEDPELSADLARLEQALLGFRALPPVGTPVEDLTPEQRALLDAIGY